MRFILCLAATLMFFGPGQAETSLEDIAISRLGDSIQVDITLSGPSSYEHFLTKTGPQRIVIDFTGVLNNWPKKRFDDLPLKSIEKIRTSQYQIKPEYVTRVVLDINRPIGYRVEKLPSGARIKLPALADEREFRPWNARPLIISTAKQKDIKVVAPTAKKKTVATQKKPTVSIEAFPKRKLIKYKPGGHRDPFKPLIGTGAHIMTGQVPSLENLSLVGILEEEAGNQALFEDSEGNGYILKPRDRVKNGYLVSVEKDKAIFQITEYGWTRTVALNLQIPELK